MSEIIKVKDLTKIFKRGSEEIHAVDNINFSIQEGEIVSVIGPSGSGKTTLVNILGCLDNPTSGELWLKEQEIFKSGLVLSEKELTLIRRKYFGYIFQKFFLLPTLSVKENIMLPSIFGKELNVDESKAKEVMELLGIAKRENHLPSELSGGEMQRVAIARALVTNPQVLIADEPTGNLDTERTEEIKKLLLELNKQKNITIILVTHDPEFAKVAHKILKIKDGKLI